MIACPQKCLQLVLLTCSKALCLPWSFQNCNIVITHIQACILLEKQHELIKTRMYRCICVYTCPVTACSRSKAWNFIGLNHRVYLGHKLTDRDLSLNPELYSKSPPALGLDVGQELTCFIQNIQGCNWYPTDSKETRLPIRHNLNIAQRAYESIDRPETITE